MEGEARRYVAYYRVSTEGQGDSGLGLEAQRRKVREHINGNGAEIVAEYQEVESGTAEERPQLERALQEAEALRATLVVAKLDRLARNAGLLHRLKDSDVGIEFANMPHANGFTVNILAAVAEHEAEMISERTREALQAAKDRGEKLGAERPECRNLSQEDREKGAAVAAEKRQERADRRAEVLAPIVEDLRAEGATSLRALARGLEERGVPTARGGEWHAATVSNLLERIEALEGEVA